MSFSRIKNPNEKMSMRVYAGAGDSFGGMQGNQSTLTNEMSFREIKYTNLSEVQFF